MLPSTSRPTATIPVSALAGREGLPIGLRHSRSPEALHDWLKGPGGRRGSAYRRAINWEICRYIY